MSLNISPFLRGEKALEAGENSYNAMIERHKKKAERAEKLGDEKSQEKNNKRAKELEENLEIKTIATKRLGAIEGEK